MGRASQEFDEQLFTRKLSDPARQMQIESVASDKAATHGASGPAKLDLSNLTPSQIREKKAELLRQARGG